jgi:methylenetetrahydrofolate reductase (NADPH)
MNSNYLLTINSQPKVNGVRSNDPKFGWGPENGYVYQKAYFEFFCHHKLIKELVAFLNQHEEITYQAINMSGERYQNVEENDVNAVTWGVFRGKEVIQPTVVDHQAFLIWKNECFKAFSQTWAAIYRPTKTSPGEEESIRFLEEQAMSLFLVNVVDNDYIHGDLNNLIHTFIEDNSDLIKSLQ